MCAQADSKHGPTDAFWIKPKTYINLFKTDVVQGLEPVVQLPLETKAIGNRLQFHILQQRHQF